MAFTTEVKAGVVADFQRAKGDTVPPEEEPPLSQAQQLGLGFTADDEIETKDDLADEE